MAEIAAKVIEGNEQRYQFTWPDKAKTVHAANQPIYKTLRPCREESVHFDDTENLYIEGDNLEVLKLLQESYLGRVKMIYIDPPYNTGNDFVYNDRFTMDSDEWDDVSGNYDDDGNRLFKNTDSNGRFHTDWLNMMYPRLKIARDLLRDDGVIFISIDDNEVHNLRKMCDEVFGVENFVAEFIWKKKKGGGNDSIYVAIEHEYILMYSKNKNELSRLFHSFSQDYLCRYKERDTEGLYFWDTFKRKSGKQYYAIYCPDGTSLEYDELGNKISWLRSESRFKEDIKKGEIRISKINDKWSVQFKQRMPKGKKPRSILMEYGTTSDGSSNLLEFFNKHFFDNPKPFTLIKHLMECGLDRNDIILDFFSGSATTAHAVMQLNADDGGKRKYIMVQLPEATDEKSEAYKAGYKNICEIGKERIRRAGAKIKAEVEQANTQLTLDGTQKNTPDIGFRVLKVDSTNMGHVYYTPKEYTQNMLVNLEENIKKDRTAEDLLFQVMLELAVPLSSRIEELSIDNTKVFSLEVVGQKNYLMACFDSKIQESTVEYIAKQKPYYFVMRDNSISTDSLSTNFEQIFATYSPDTQVKVL